MKQENDKKPKISLFIPLFNEEKIIHYHLYRINKLLKELPDEFEIFIVNDASTDESIQILQDISKIYKNVTPLNYRLGPTRRENLAQAFRKANGNIIVFLDMDLATNLRYLPRLIKQVEKKGYDIATGSRYVKGSKIKRTLTRRVISELYNRFIRIYFGTGILDHECGFKAFKKDVILRLVDEMGYDKTLKRGVFWDTELLVRARLHNYKIIELPIGWSEGNKSALSFRREIKMVPYIFKFKKRIEIQKKRMKKKHGLK